MNSERSVVDIIVVGAGPSGLACAIEAIRAGLSVLVLDKGAVADAIRRFPTMMTWFSTPELLEIGRVPFVVPTVRPSRVDTLNYYQRVADHYALDVRSHDAVVRVERTNDNFVVGTAAGKVYHSRSVIIATGYFDTPGRLGVPGEERPTVAHYYLEPFQHFGQSVVVVGGSNSAVEAALDLFRHRVQVTLVHREEHLSPRVKYWVMPDIENRIKKGEVRAHFCTTVREFCDQGVVLATPTGITTVPAAFSYVLIGFRPDAASLQRYGVRIRPDTLEPEHDERTFETNIPGLFIAGSVVAGTDNNRVFVENGRLHAHAIVPAIAARLR